MRATDLHPERARRLLLILRELRDGQPVALADLADAMGVRTAQVPLDLDALREQGCLIDEEDGYVRMVDDHLPAGLSDAALTAATETPARGRASARRVAA